MDEKRSSNLREVPCPICSGVSFMWGFMVGESPSSRVFTQPDKAGWGDGKTLMTRECKACGNVPFFIETALANG